MPFKSKAQQRWGNSPAGIKSLGAKKRMGANAYNSRKVIQCDKKGNKIRIYDSLADAYRTTNTRVQDIYNCCKSRQKTANGFIWKYYN